MWVEGGSGVANLSDWLGSLDTLIKRHAATGSLADAWLRFTNAYLADAKSWGDWTGVATWIALTDVPLDGAKTSGLFRSIRSTTPNVSAGGVLFRVANTNSVTIGVHITGFPAERAMSAETSWYGLAPGDGADGNVTQLALQYSANTAVYDGSFRLGPEK